MHPPGVGDGIFGKAARRRAHDAVAGLEVLDLAADRLDLAGAFQPDPRADAADAAVLDAGGDQEVGAVEARGAHLDQHLVRLRLGLRQVADLDTFFAENCCFHDDSSRWPRCAIVPANVTTRHDG